MDETTPTEETKSQSSLGPLSAAIVIVLIFLVGGVYFVLKQQERNQQLKIQNEQIQLPDNS